MTTKLTIFRPHTDIAGLKDIDFVSPSPTEQSPEWFKREGRQRESQIILMKGQLGQFKPMCPPEWEVNLPGKNRHLVFVSEIANVALNTMPRSSVFGGTKCLDNAKRGVSQGYAVSLELVGLGYAAEISTGLTKKEFVAGQKQQPPLERLAQSANDWIMDEKKAQAEGTDVIAGRGRHMILNLGKSHRIFHYVDSKAVDVVSIRGKDNSMTVLIPGISRSIVNQIAAEISRYRKPSVYSTKGINNAESARRG